MRGLWRDRRGTTVVEFALVASAFLLLLIGGMEVGLLWWTENAVRTTASLTARCLALQTSCKTSADAASFAVSTAQKFLPSAAVNTSDVTVSINNSPCFGSAGSYSRFTKVTVTSELWAGTLIRELAGARVQAVACFPNPSPS